MELHAVYALFERVFELTGIRLLVRHANACRLPARARPPELLPRALHRSYSLRWVV